MTFNPKTFPKAYEPSLNEINESDFQRFLSTLYRGSPSSYTNAQSSYSPCRVQWTVLFNEFERLIEYSVQHAFRENKQVIEINLFSGDYLGSSTEEAKVKYYEDYKKYLEKILFLISRDNSRTRQQKSTRVAQLFNDINVCSTGAITQLGQTLFDLTPIQVTLTSRLASLRKSIIDTYAGNYIRSNGIHQGSEIHVTSFFNDIAQEEGWNIPGYNRIDGYVDQFPVHGLNEHQKELFVQHFKREYTPNAICTEIRDWYHELLRAKQPLLAEEIVSCQTLNDINNILQPFSDNGICDTYLVLDINEAYEMTFKSDFSTQAFQDKFLGYVQLLLVVQKVVPCENPLIKCLNDEIERLQAQGKTNDDYRVKQLQETRLFIWLTLRDTKKTPVEKKQVIEEHIKDLYLNNKLDEYVQLLLVVQKVFPCENPLIKCLNDEIERLQAQGKTNDDYRVKQLQETRLFIWLTLRDTKKTPVEKKQVIEEHIKDLYLNNKLDEYGVLRKIGISLLNILMLTVIPGLIKYATTGHFFFSMHGKTQDLINQIHKSPSMIEGGLSI